MRSFGRRASRLRKQQSVCPDWVKPASLSSVRMYPFAGCGLGLRRERPLVRPFHSAQRRCVRCYATACAPALPHRWTCHFAYDKKGAFSRLQLWRAHAPLSYRFAHACRRLRRGSDLRTDCTAVAGGDRTAVRRFVERRRDGRVDEDHGGGAQSGRLAARQGERRDGSWPSSRPGAGTRISRRSRCSIRRRSARRLELLGDAPFKATLTEPPIPGDADLRARQGRPARLSRLQGDGDVTAPLVYVNYGMPDDYDALERLGVSVKGKIVIARYGEGWRGLKPKLAQEHGARRLHHLFRPARRRLRRRRMPIRRARAPRERRAARLRRRHDAISRAIR